MSKKKICFIAQFPPPMHGLSKAVETLYNSRLNEEFEFEKIDITNNKKLINNLIYIWKNEADLFYFTISQTKGGNIRDLVILKLLSLQNKKCLIHLHGGYYRKLVDNDLPGWQRKMNYKAISKLDGVIVLSDLLKGIFRGMISDDKIVVVQNCVDDQFLMPNAEFEEKLKAVEKKGILHVLYLSNFIKTKGYQEVLELARLEKERCDRGERKRFHFDFAGKFFEDDEKEFFETFVIEYNLNKYITYHGIVGGEKKKLLLKESDIFILLTRYPNEGQPISILEAMSNGMVIVTTDHAGIPDIVKDGVNGIVFSTKVMGNTDICSNIYENINHIYNWNKIINMNRKTIIDNYSECKYITNMKTVFKHKN